MNQEILMRWMQMRRPAAHAKAASGDCALSSYGIPNAGMATSSDGMRVRVFEEKCLSFNQYLQLQLSFLR